MEQGIRLADELMNNRGVLLKDKGYQTDVQEIEYAKNGNLVFYHFTRHEKVEQVLKNGLYAFRPVACPNPPKEFNENFLAEGFLEPVPKWLNNNYYYGDLGMEMVRKYIGDILLRMEIPVSFPSVYIADYAHILECKHLDAKGSSPLNLGYKCDTGFECTQGYVNSYVPVQSYQGGHIAPIVQFLRKGEGITIPSNDIEVAEIQPFSKVEKTIE